MLLIQGQHLIEDYPFILAKYILYTHHIFQCKRIFDHFQSESSFFQVLPKQNFESYCPVPQMGMEKLLIYWSWNSHVHRAGCVVSIEEELSLGKVEHKDSPLYLNAELKKKKNPNNRILLQKNIKQIS